METPAFSSGSRRAHARCSCALGLGRIELRVDPRRRRRSRVLDTIYTTQAKVLSVAPATAFPPLRVFWSVNNVPAIGQSGARADRHDLLHQQKHGPRHLRAGQGERRYRRIRRVGHRARMGALLPVGLQPRRFAGGSHSLSDLLDRRLAFSEGWGNAWSGIALGRSNYTDSVGAGAGAGLQPRPDGGRAVQSRLVSARHRSIRSCGT